MSYGKEGVKVLQQDYKDLKANPPKIEKTKDKNGDIFATMIYSNVVKDYIVVSEWSDLRMARKDLVVLKKDNKATLDKIKRLSMQESVEEEVIEEGLAELGMGLSIVVGLFAGGGALSYGALRVSDYLEKDARTDWNRIFNSDKNHKTAMQLLSKNKRTKRFMTKSKDMAKKSPAEIKAFKDEFFETVREEFDGSDLKAIEKALKSMGQKVKLSVKESLDEGKKDYEIYHKSYTSATQEVIKYVEKNGYSIDFDDVWAQSVTFGRGKPSEGKTVRHKIPLLKNGKETKKYVNFQVYGLGNANNNRALNNYELNLYIS